MKKSDILQALTIVKPGLSNKEVIEQASSFAFIDGHIVTYNDEISISAPVEGLEIEGAIKAEILYGLLSKIKAEEIDMQVVGNELIVKAGRTKAGITLQEEILLPLEEIATKSKWKAVPEGFSKYLAFAADACSADMSNAKLTCVHVTEEGLLQASDNYKIVQIDLKAKMPVKNFLLPSASAKIVAKMNPVKISEGEGWVHFKTEAGTTIACRVYDDEFPVIEKILKVQGQEVTFPANLSKVLERAGVFTKRERSFEESVEIELTEKRLIVKATSDNGWFTESLNIEYPGKPMQFVITPYLLKDILSETLECVVGERLLKFETEDWIYVSALKNS